MKNDLEFCRKNVDVICRGNHGYRLRSDARAFTRWQHAFLVFPECLKLVIATGSFQLMPGNQSN